MQGTANGVCGVQSSIGGFFPPQYTVLIYQIREVERVGVKRTIQGSRKRDPLTPLPQPLTLSCGPPTPVQWVLGLLPRVKWSGHSNDHQPQPTAKVKERVELYLSSPSQPSWQVIR